MEWIYPSICSYTQIREKFKKWLYNQMNTLTIGAFYGNVSELLVAREMHGNESPWGILFLIAKSQNKFI